MISHFKMQIVRMHQTHRAINQILRLIEYLIFRVKSSGSLFPSLFVSLSFPVILFKVPYVNFLFQTKNFLKQTPFSVDKFVTKGK